MAAALAAVLAVAWRALPGRPNADGAAEDLVRLGRSDPDVRLLVFVKDFPGTGRGLAAAQRFEAGDVVIEVPLGGSASISGAVGAGVAKHSRETVALNGDQRAKRDLVVSLLHERQMPGTKWEPLFRALPLGISNLAAMQDVHRRALNGTDVGAKFKEFDDIVASANDAIRGARGLISKTPTEEEIRWAAAVIASRAHRFAGMEERILWPYLVLINHHPDVGETLEYSVSAGPPKVFQLRARKAIQEGEEVFAHYGHYSNLRLLVQYGFSIPDNPWLEPTPMRLLKAAGPGIFRFMDEMPARGPQCQTLASERLETLTRRKGHKGRLPPLLVQCWRLGAFEDLAGALEALDAGLLDDAPARRPQLPVQVLERDAAVLEGIAAACAAERTLLSETAPAAAALSALTAAGDSLGAGLLRALDEEAESWRECEGEMLRWAALARGT